MMKYKKGDILICSANRTTIGHHLNLTIGDKYELLESTDLTSGSYQGIPDEFSKIVLGVRNIKTGQEHRWVSDRLFITLEVYREFKLREILSKNPLI